MQARKNNAWASCRIENAVARAEILIQMPGINVPDTSGKQNQVTLG